MELLHCEVDKLCRTTHLDPLNYPTRCWSELCAPHLEGALPELTLDDGQRSDNRVPILPVNREKLAMFISRENSDKDVLGVTGE
jgi:hypothetical protein